VISTLKPKLKNTSGFFRRQPLYTAIVVVPFTIALLYLVFMSSDRYVSRATLIVQSDSSTSSPELDLGLLSLGSNSSLQDALLVQQFIESPAMVAWLDKDLGLRQHFSAKSIDAVARLGDDVTDEQLRQYLLKHLTVTIDDASMTIELDIDAFSPEYAQSIAEAIISHSEAFVNDISHQLALEQMKFIQDELKSGNDRLKAASEDLIRYQNENQIFSPEVENTTVSQIITNMQAQLAEQNTQLKTLQSYMSPAAPEVIAAKRQIDALQRQIEQERQKQVSKSGQDALNDQLVAYSRKELELQISTDLYTNGLKTLEAVRLEASRQVKHLVRVSAPTLPDGAERPRKLYDLILLFVVLNAVYLIGTLLAATIRDHRA